jgi:hypothetical protein
MPKIKALDNPYVVKYIEGQRAKASNEATKAAIAAAKNATDEYVEFHALAGAKDMVFAAKAHGKAVVDAIRATKLAG